MSPEVAALNQKIDVLYQEIQDAYRVKPDIDAAVAADRYGNPLRYNLALQAQARHDNLIKRLEFREKALYDQLHRAETRAARAMSGPEPTWASAPRRVRSLADDFEP